MDRTITDRVVIGTRIHSILCGGRVGVVYAIKGDLSPASCGGAAGVTWGGRAWISIVFNNGTKTEIPESILRGVQWRIYTDVVGPEVIAFMLDFEATEKTRREAEATAAANKFSEACAALRVDPQYSKLLQTSNTRGGGVHVAKNIRTELKAAFPGMKFSVTSSYSSVNISWVDGPTTHQVEAITGKYSGGSFNGMEDIYAYRRSPFTEVFGSAQYIFENRHYSKATLEAASRVIENNYGSPAFTVQESWEGHAHLGSCDHDDQRRVYDYLEHRYPFEEEEAA